MRVQALELTTNHNAYMSPTHAKFASFIIRNRKSLGLSQPELASKVGVTKSNVFYWEAGQYLPQLDVLERLARTLQVSYEDLLIQGRYPRHEVGPTTYYRRQGYSQKAVTELEGFLSTFEKRYGKRTRKGRR